MSATGFQVKARDHDGNVHDERWSAEFGTAKTALEAVREDPLVEAAWIVDDEGALVVGPTDRF